MVSSRNGNRPVPDGEHLLALFEAAASNARDLLADAECLMGAESFARAHALAVFAEEELGKAKLCLVAGVRPTGARVDPKEFWKEFYSHEGKLLRELSTQGLLDEEVSSVEEFIGSLPAESGSVHRRKVRGLYVDYQDGVILVPGEVGRSEAQQAIDEARASLGTLDMAFKAEGALDQLRALMGTGLEQYFREVVQLLAPGLDVSGWDADRLYQEIFGLVMAEPDRVLRVLQEMFRDFPTTGE
jgi:AbiV family abortive infection protein